MAEFTPMMQHYLQTKKENPGCILFYRLGDFYEMFFDDAVLVSRELELTLTGKSCGMEERAPMCGIPYHALDNYLSRLVNKGYKVAICEQVEDPKEAKGMVKREVVRIVTPGTNIDNMALDETKNNYIMSIAFVDDKYGIAVADVTTADFLVQPSWIPKNSWTRSTSTIPRRSSATKPFWSAVSRWMRSENGFIWWSPPWTRSILTRNCPRICS